MKILELPEIKIFGIPQIVYCNKEYQLFDYEIYNNNFYLIVYEKRLEKSKLLMVDKDLNPLCLKDIGTPVGIFEDCSNHLNLITFLYPYTIYPNKECFEMIFTKQNLSNKLNKPSVASTDNGLIYSYHYGETRLTADYSMFNTITKKDTVFRHIEDSLNFKKIDFSNDKKKVHVSKRGSMADSKISQWTGRDNIYFDPLLNEEKNEYLYCPLFYVDDSLYLFNHLENKIEVFDKNCVIKRNIAIFYTKESGWLKKIIVDKVTNKFYTCFIKNDRYRIAEIDIVSGLFKESFSLNYPWVDKIQVINGVLYFLYKTTKNDFRKSLYKQIL